MNGCLNNVTGFLIRADSINLIACLLYTSFIAMELLQKYDETKAENVLKLENKVDHYEDRLGTYLIRLSSRDLSEKDSKSLSMLLHCIGDLAVSYTHLYLAADPDSDQRCRQTGADVRIRRHFCLRASGTRPDSFWAPPCFLYAFLANRCRRS